MEEKRYDVEWCEWDGISWRNKQLTDRSYDDAIKAIRNLSKLDLVGEMIER